VRNGRFHLNRPKGASVQSSNGSRGVRISGSNAGYTMFRGSVKSTGYPLHSLDSPSLPLPCVAVCHHISTGVYHFSDERTAPIFTVGVREVRLLYVFFWVSPRRPIVVCRRFGTLCLLHISCALFPLARAGIWLLSPSVNLSFNLAVPRVCFTYFHPAEGSKNCFRTLISGRTEMSHAEVRCVDILLIEMAQQ
jgi:hypothetical protein